MEKKANKPSDSKFKECVYCANFFGCKDRKHKREKCLNFREDTKNERSKMDQD